MFHTGSEHYSGIVGGCGKRLQTVSYGYSALFSEGTTTAFRNTWPLCNFLYSLSKRSVGKLISFYYLLLRASFYGRRKGFRESKEIKMYWVKSVLKVITCVLGQRLKTYM